MKARNKTTGIVFFLSAISFLSGGANAQWFHQQKENAFDESKSFNMAITATASFGFGFVCEGREHTALRFMTPETWSDNFSSLSALGKMKIRIDKGNIHELDISAQDASGKTLLQANDPKVVEIANEISKAKKRISVGIFLLGQMAYNENFSAHGSTRASEKAFNNCGITN